MDNAPPPGATDKEAAKWKTAKKKKDRADNPLTVRQVSTDPTTGATTTTFYQAGRTDPLWKTTAPPEQPKWTLSGAIKGKPSEPQPKP